MLELAKFESIQHKGKITCIVMPTLKDVTCIICMRNKYECHGRPTYEPNFCEKESVS